MDIAAAASRMGVAERHLEAIVRLVEREIPECEVWVFGSRADGSSYDGSDIDLAIRGSSRDGTDSCVNWSKIFDLQNGLDESDIPYMVDLMPWEALPSRIQGRAQEHHIVIHQP